MRNSNIRVLLTLGAVILVDHALCAASSDIIWTSPSDGDIFGPGDTIVGKWNASTAIVSPSFRLCMSSEPSEPSEPDTGLVARERKSDTGDGSCGSSVWPAVEQSEGSYLISL
jgi:hypothetical protein